MFSTRDKKKKKMNVIELKRIDAIV
jgi:hypothetical protein